MFKDFSCDRQQFRRGIFNRLFKKIFFILSSIVMADLNIYFLYFFLLQIGAGM